VILERCTGVYCVDIGESFQTHISYLVKLLPKFGFDTVENEPYKVSEAPFRRCTADCPCGMAAEIA